MSIQSEINRINTAVSDQESLIGEVVDALAKRCVVTEPLLQARTVTPTEEVQVVTPDAGYDGLSSVTVEAAQGGEGAYGWKKSLSKLPSGYTEVEYIQSSGTQYIDTGLLPAEVDKVSAVFQKPNNHSDTATIFGCLGSNFYCPLLYTASGGVAFIMNSSWTFSNVFLADNGSVFAETSCQTGSPTVLTVNGVSYTGVNAVAPSNNITMFTTLSGSTLTWAKPIRIGSAKMWKSGILLRDFIAVKRDSDGVAGMYDLVDGRFYSNAGSGAFAAGSATSSPSATVVVGYAVSDDAGAYPNKEFLNGYYYEKL